MGGAGPPDSTASAVQGDGESWLLAASLKAPLKSSVLPWDTYNSSALPSFQEITRRHFWGRASQCLRMTRRQILQDLSAPLCLLQHRITDWMREGTSLVSVQTRVIKRRLLQALSCQSLNIFKDGQWSLFHPVWPPYENHWKGAHIWRYSAGSQPNLSATCQKLNGITPLYIVSTLLVL